MNGQPDVGFDDSLSIVVVYRDRPEHLTLALECLARQGLEQKQTRVIVSDYGSADPMESAAIAQRACPFPCGTVFTAERGEWWNARAKNLGVLQAHGDWLLLLNPDCWLKPHALLKAFAEAQFLHQEGRRAIVQGQRWDLGSALTKDILGTGYEALHPLFDLAGQAPGITLHSREAYGDFQLMRREDYWEIGGYDEEFTGWGADDTDFADRAKEKDFELVWRGGRGDHEFVMLHPWHERDTSAHRRNMELLQRKRDERKRARTSS